MSLPVSRRAVINLSSEVISLLPAATKDLLRFTPLFLIKSVKAALSLKMEFDVRVWFCLEEGWAELRAVVSSAMRKCMAAARRQLPSATWCILLA